MKEASPRERARRTFGGHARRGVRGFERFQALLVSTAAINRADDGRHGLLGLVDRGTGMRYVIEEEKLPIRPRSYAS